MGIVTGLQNFYIETETSPSHGFCWLSLWTTALAVSAAKKEKKKEVKSKVRVGNPPKHKAMACDTRGQCSLAISVVGQNQKPKESASQANALQKKRPQFWTSKSTLSVLKSCMIYRILFKSFRVDHLSNVSKHTVSGKAENLQHIPAQGKHGVTPTIFTFCLWVHKIIASLTWIEQGNNYSCSHSVIIKILIC